jgi:cyclophilin family peptidyl-prolyl cis-trans isomerase
MSFKQKVLPFTLLLSFAACAVETGDSEAEAEQPAEVNPREAAAAVDDPLCVLETSMGTIVLQLDRVNAPRSTNNFEVHVNAGFYNGLQFHRVMPNFVIQAGLLTADYAPRRSSAAFLQNEGDNGLKNVRGSLAMARGQDPHSAKSEFFINVKDNPQLDTDEEEWGWAVFGQVTEGLDVVDRIKDVPTRTRGTREDIPADPVLIEQAYMTTMELWQASSDTTSAAG